MTDCFDDLPQSVRAGSRRLEVTHALGQFLGLLRKLLLAICELALQCTILSLQIGNLAPHISGLALNQILHCRLLAQICHRRGPLRIALRRRLSVSPDQLFKHPVLLFQVGEHPLECIARRLPFLLLRSVRGKRTLHLKLQLLFEFCNQALQFTMKFAVPLPQRLLIPRVGGRRLPSTLLNLLPDLCDEVLKIANLSPQIIGPMLNCLALPQLRFVRRRGRRRSRARPHVLAKSPSNRQAHSCDYRKETWH
jgi:hypothetical protein